jgi:hypothetical protein
MFDYKNTKIPFRVGQSTVYGADCVGLGILYLKSKGFKCEWESELVRGIGKYDYYKSCFDKYGFVRDPEGDIFLQRFMKNAHIGVILENMYVYQSNITMTTEYLEIPKNGYRYSYLGDK